MKVISIVNHKGGVGKTTVTLNLGAELARRGHKVLLIDLDSQGNLSDAAGVTQKLEEDGGKTIATALNHLMKDELGDPEDYIYASTLTESVDIIPCSIDMAETKLAMFAFVARERLLKTFLQEVAKHKRYDYVLIDNAPSIDVDFQNALVASDGVLIVAEADKFSANGIESLLRQVTTVKKYFNSSLKICGIVINKVDKRTLVARSMMDSMRKVFDLAGGIRIFDTVIPQAVKLKETPFFGVSIREYDSGSPAAKAFSLFADEFIDAVDADEERA